MGIVVVEIIVIGIIVVEIIVVGIIVAAAGLRYLGLGT